MFSRQVFRPAATLRQSVRRYATEPPKGGSSTVRNLGLVAAAAAVGGAYYLNSAKSPTPAATESKPAGQPKPAFTGGDQGFLSLALEKVEEINHNTKKLRFKLPEEDMTSGLHVASAVITKYKGPEMEKPVIRPYTPISDVDDKGYLDFIIKRYPNGAMSEHMHNLIPGQRLDIKGPIPKFPWTPNKHETVVMIAGGTGITPMWQVANAIMKNPEDRTKVTLISANITEDDILLKDELAELENTYPQRFRAFYVLDKPPEKWQGGKGFVSKELLKTLLPEPKEGDKIKIFVCGPPPMYNAISGGKKSPSDQGELDGYLKELGYSKDQVYKF
ncbi:ferredoxin reductase-like protein [Mytilinidion resinicola]|uniref:NADH-cytochrome b5 reductase n=1 Tax=Mytilinidion resinicola TaxID=574789 RepID=A0A6A6XYD0_9PEZI|nr:ferredoxin reductase-like protein [Mytilinidion resinicola]KAF2801561.1 ferredoxin reductase-like protein [Mytilinidion resinicola]